MQLFAASLIITTPPVVRGVNLLACISLIVLKCNELIDYCHGLCLIAIRQSVYYVVHTTIIG